MWEVRESTRRRTPGFEIHVAFRGVELWGYGLDDLEPADADLAAAAVAGLNLTKAGELGECVLRGDLPCEIQRDGRRAHQIVRFALDLTAEGLADPSRPQNLRLSIDLDGRLREVVDDWFDDAMRLLQEALPGDTRLVCCHTCLLSDYSPLGHGLLGMRCHRDARAQYLAVRSKPDYFAVPVTEDVPETYVCARYEPRRPGTGYRG